MDEKVQAYKDLKPSIPAFYLVSAGLATTRVGWWRGRRDGLQPLQLQVSINGLKRHYFLPVGQALHLTGKKALLFDTVRPSKSWVNGEL